MTNTDFIYNTVMKYYSCFSEITKFLYGILPISVYVLSHLIIVIISIVHLCFCYDWYCSLIKKTKTKQNRSYIDEIDRERTSSFDGLATKGLLAQAQIGLGFKGRWCGSGWVRVKVQNFQPIRPRTQTHATKFQIVFPLICLVQLNCLQCVRTFTL